MVRPTLIALNPVELKYYPFITSLNKCGESCNVLSPKISGILAHVFGRIVSI